MLSYHGFFGFVDKGLVHQGDVEEDVRCPPLCSRSIPNARRCEACLSRTEEWDGAVERTRRKACEGADLGGEVDVVTEGGRRERGGVTRSSVVVRRPQASAGTWCGRWQCSGVGQRLSDLREARLAYPIFMVALCQNLLRRHSWLPYHRQRHVSTQPPPPCSSPPNKQQPRPPHHQPVPRITTITIHPSTSRLSSLPVNASNIKQRANKTEDYGQRDKKQTTHRPTHATSCTPLHTNHHTPHPPRHAFSFRFFRVLFPYMLSSFASLVPSKSSEMFVFQDAIAFEM